MKIKLTGSLLALSVLFGAAGLSASRWAHSDEWRRDYDRRFHREREHAFAMGVCVGQTLAQQGVTLPAPQPGARPSPDPTTETAFKAALQQCRTEFSGTSPTASPTPVPSADPTATPTTTPITTPTPDPTSAS